MSEQLINVYRNAKGGAERRTWTVSQWERMPKKKDGSNAYGWIVDENQTTPIAQTKGDAGKDKADFTFPELERLNLPKVEENSKEETVVADPVVTEPVVETPPPVKQPAPEGPLTDDQIKAKAAELFAAGKKVKEIGAELGVPWQKINSLLKAAK